MVEGARPALGILARAKRLKEPFALVLTDCHMPETDGFTLVEQIKKNPEVAGVIVMMLTSGGRRGDAARCRELGIAAYLTKPVQELELLDTLLRVLGHHLEIPDQPELVTRHSLREGRTALRILLAEDNPVNQLLAVRLLEKRGHKVVVAGDGRQALAALEKQTFDVALMDVQMPEMDGLEATAAIREKEKTTGTHLPIIAMTAHAMTGDRERFLSAGMDGYVAKPIRADELFNAIDAVLASHASTPKDVGSEDRAADKIIDVTAALDRIDGDSELLEQLAGLFLEECPKLFTEIQDAVSRKDTKALARTAHTFKGSVGNFGAKARNHGAKLRA